MVSVCGECDKPSFPVSTLSACCGARTRLGQIKTEGVLLEHSKSHLGGSVSQFGLVEMSGIRLIGNFTPDAKLEPRMKVKMVKCGVATDGTPFYYFSPIRKE